MPKGVIGAQYIIHVIFAVLLVLSAGCVGQPADTDEADPGAGEVSAPEAREQAESPVSGDEEVSPLTDLPEGPAGEWIRLAIEEQDGLTQEDVDAIVGYGVIQFPESVINGENSRRQGMPDGTEIYTLEFGVETSIEAVGDWYRDHLESGFAEDNRDRGNNSVMVGFEYQAPDGTWFKSITLNGVRGDNRCMINVYLSRMGMQAAEDESGE